MKKIISILLIIILFPLQNLNAMSNINTPETTELWIQFPEGEIFKKLEEIAYLAKIWSYRYTSVEEESFKILITKHYQWNEEFFSSLARKFRNFDENNILSLAEILSAIPSGTPITPFDTNNNYNIGQSLLDASFEIKWEENYFGMLHTIQEKIEQIARNNCREEKNNSKCFDDNKYINNFLPTIWELYEETIWLNGKPVQIETLKDEFNYEIIHPKDNAAINVGKIFIEKSKSMQELQKLLGHPYLKYYTPENWNFLNVDKADETLLWPENKVSVPELDKKVLDHCIEVVKKSYDFNFYNDLWNFIIQNKNRPNNTKLENFIKNYKPKTHLNWDHTCIYEAKKEWLEKLEQNWKIPENESTKTINDYLENNKNNTITYKLSYKKEFFTLEEAKKSLEITKSNGQNSFIKNNIILTEDGERPNCPNGNIITQTDCTRLTRLLNNFSLGLNSYYTDYDKYPEKITDLKLYVKNPDDFNEIFSYKSTNNGKWFEIIYIGESIWQTENLIKQKDYLVLLGDQKIPEIPEIFANIPNDDMAIFVKNPKEFWQLLSENDSIFPKFENFLSSESIKNFIKKFFITENFEEISQNIDTSFAIVVENLDITSPELIMIFDKNEKAFFENKNFKIKEKGNFIFISKSEKILENFLKKIENNTMNTSWDFQYVWTKKSEKIQWAFVFVGDRFFEKMIQFENFIFHFRKINQYREFLSVQQEYWAYENIFKKPVDNIQELTKIPENSKDLYYIENNILHHKNLGNIANILPISENNYTLDTISRNELDTYKSSILWYREVWQASLDPMGIILNSKNNGIEVDFFMTPIPNISGALGEIINNFRNISRENLDFENKIQLKNWLGSFNFGFDEEKLQKAISSQPIISMLYSNFSSEVLWWKNIFEFLKWEVWFFVYHIEDDILAIENIEKADENNIDFKKIHAGIAIGLQSNEKWKEFITILKNISEKFPLDWEEKIIVDKIFNPQIESYSGTEIYTINNIIPELSPNINFSYTFFNDFFIISINKDTIKKVIDENKNPSKNPNNQEKYKIFSLKINGKNIENNFWNIFTKFREKNKNLINEMLMEIGDDFDFHEMNSFLSTYYTYKIFNEKVSGKFEDFSYQLGDIKIFSKNKEFFIQSDIEKFKNRVKENSTISTHDIEDFFTRYQKLFDNFQNGVEIDNPKINDDEIGILMMYNGLLPILENLKDANILKNLSFDFMLKDDEVGFHLEYHTSQETTTTEQIFEKILPKNGDFKNIIFIAIIGIFIAILGILGFMHFKKTRRKL